MAANASRNMVVAEGAGGADGGCAGGGEFCGADVADAFAGFFA